MSIFSPTKFAMTTLMMMIFIIPQSFFELKLPLLGILLSWFLVAGFRGHWKIRTREFLPYYLIFCFMSCVWAMIGFIKGNLDIAILESIRVYVLYMVIYCILTIYISNIDYQAHVDGIVVAGGLGIGLVAFATLADQVFQMNLIPQFIKEDMYLQLGIHDGYLEMNNVNIGMLTFIVPYLLSRLMMSERKDRHSYLIFGLVVSVAAAIVASRRVVLVLIIITPLLINAINLLTAQPMHLPLRRWNRAAFIFLLTIGLGIGSVYFLGLDFLDGFINRNMSAFDLDPSSPRPLQHAALLSGFYENFFWGSGFGGVSDVVRSYDRPWTFELTYSRLLFNGGVIGFGLVMLFYLIFLFLVLRKIRRSSHAHAMVYIALLTGFLSVSLAAASNPYLSSFDFLFALSIIPLILNSDEKRQNC